MPRYKLILLINLIVIVFLLLWLGAKSGISLQKLENFIKNLGFFAPLVYILIYTIGPSLFIPIIPLNITAGVLFGPVFGTVYAVIGATLGACIAFLISRYLVKDWMDQKVSNNLVLIQRRIREDGWKFIAISRITPIFPFNIQNYVFGVTDIDFKTFTIATLFSIIPGSFTFVYAGYAGTVAVTSKSGGLKQIIIAVILLLLFSFLPYIIKKAKGLITKIHS